MIISSIIDKHLQHWIDIGLNKIPGNVDPEMTDDAGPDEEGWTTWYPIASTVTDEEINIVENSLGYTLPSGYKVFLKHKHFYELHINEAEFGCHDIKGWKTNFTEAIFNGWPREYLIDKGYIPFAIWSDWGALCFNTNQPISDNDYAVILWDHEASVEYQPFSSNFQEALIKLDKLHAQHSQSK